MPKYEDLSLDDLRDIASERKIPGRGGKNKDDLVALILKFEEENGKPIKNEEMNDPGDYSDLSDDLQPAPEDDQAAEAAKEETVEVAKPEPKEEPKPAPQPAVKEQLFKLTNDIRVNQNGSMYRMKAGKILSSLGYDIDLIRKSGGNLQPVKDWEGNPDPTFKLEW